MRCPGAGSNPNPEEHSCPYGDTHFDPDSRTFSDRAADLYANPSNRHPH